MISLLGNILRIIASPAVIARPVFALFKVFFSIFILVPTCGYVFFIAFVSTLPEETAQHLYRTVLSPLEYFRYGLMVFTAGADYQTFTRIAPWLIVTLVGWYFFVKLSAWTGTSFSKEAKARLEEKAERNSEDKKDSTNSGANGFDFWIGIAIAAVVTVALFRLLDLLLCLGILTALLALAGVIISAQVDSAGILTESILSKLVDIDVLNLNLGDVFFSLRDDFAGGQSGVFHFVTIVLVLCAWISFRNSAAFVAVRSALLVSSLILLFALASYYGAARGQGEVTLWGVQVFASQIEIDDREYLLLGKWGRKIQLLDLESNTVTELNVSDTTDLKIVRTVRVPLVTSRDEKRP